MRRVVYSLILVMLFSSAGLAEDHFPVFSETDITIELPREELPVYQVDPAHETAQKRFR